MNLLRKSAAIVLAAFLLFLTACSSGDGKTQGETTVDPRLFNSNASLINATEDTVYFLTGVEGLNNHRLSYMDRATGYAGVLCGKPECTHAGSDCNAWVDSAIVLTVAEGRVYWAEMGYGRMSVSSVALDGTDRRTEWISPEDYVQVIGNRWLKVYGNVIYLSFDSSVVVDGEYTHPIRIVAIPRDGGEAYEVLPPTDEFDSIVFLIFPAEEGLFYCGMEMAELGEDEWGTIHHIRLYDLESGETQALYDGFIPDMGLIASVWPMQDGLLIGGTAPRVYKLRYDTAELKTFFEVDGIDPHQIYLGDGLAVVAGVNRTGNATIELRVVNFDGEELSYAKYPPFSDFMTFEGYDSEYFYFHGSKGGGYDLFSVIPRDGGDVIELWDGENYRKGT